MCSGAIVAFSSPNDIAVRKAIQLGWNRETIEKTVLSGSYAISTSVLASKVDGYVDYSGTVHKWRKNRQPTPGSRYIGTDLNRNFRYHWGGRGMTSSNPAAGTYRGPSAFSAPETQHMRDFGFRQPAEQVRRPVALRSSVGHQQRAELRGRAGLARS